LRQFIQIVFVGWWWSQIVISLMLITLAKQIQKSWNYYQQMGLF